MSKPRFRAAQIFPMAVLVDSNSLLLWIVGLLDPAIIRKHKRLSTFSVSDYHLIAEYLSQFCQILTTPHILTEVSNLAGSASGALRTAIMDQLAATSSILDERFSSAADLLGKAESSIFGLTDAAIADLAAKAIILTVDGRLVHYLRLSGFTAVTLQDLRQLELE